MAPISLMGARIIALHAEPFYYTCFCGIVKAQITFCWDIGSFFKGAVSEAD